MKRFALLLLLTSVAFAGNTPANDGQDLLKSCRPVNDYVLGKTSVLPASYVDGWCLGVVHAAAQSGDEKNYSVPVEVTTGQMVAVVVKYLEAHPDQLSWPDFLLVQIALTDAFPLPKKTRKAAR